MKMHFLTLTGVGAALLSSGVAFADFEAPPRQVTIDARILEIPEQRPWDASVRLFYGKDSNVALVPEFSVYNGDKSSHFFGATLNAEYRVLQTTDWTAGASLVVDRVEYSEGKGASQTDSPDEYNLNTFTPTVFVKRRLSIAGMPTQLSASYGRRKERLELSGLDSTTSLLNFGIQLKPHSNLVLGLNLDRANSNFKESRLAPLLDSRDGHYKSYALSAKYFSNDKQRNIALTYRNGENNTDGSNFEYNFHSWGVRAETHVTGPFWLAAGYYMEDRSYHNGFTAGFVPSPGRTQQDTNELEIQILWQISNDIVADFFYTDVEYDPNSGQPIFEIDREILGFGVTYNF